MERQLVIFELSKELFGVDIGTVESIIKMQAITVIPHAASFVEGVTNLRGVVLPVVDLYKRFGLQYDAARSQAQRRIVVVTLGQTKVGMIVDGVSEVLSIPDDSIEPPPALVSSVDATFITGIAKVGERLIILLDLRKVFNAVESAELSAVAA